MPLGVGTIDAVLPGGGLKAGALHEIGAEDYRDMGAATVFCAALAARLIENGPGLVLWCQSAQPRLRHRRALWAGACRFRALIRRGLCLCYRASVTDCLWAMEEALCPAPLPPLSVRWIRRAAALDLDGDAAAATGGGRKGNASIFVYGSWRWRGQRGRHALAHRGFPGLIVPGTEKFDGLAGAPCWRAALTRVRGGVPGAWNVAGMRATKASCLSMRLCPCLRNRPCRRRRA